MLRLHQSTRGERQQPWYIAFMLFRCDGWMTLSRDLGCHPMSCLVVMSGIMKYVIHLIESTRGERWSVSGPEGPCGTSDNGKTLPVQRFFDVDERES